MKPTYLPLTLDDLINADAAAAMHYAVLGATWRARAYSPSAPGNLTRQQRLAKARAAERAVVNCAVRLEARLQRQAEAAR